VGEAELVVGVGEGVIVDVVDEDEDVVELDADADVVVDAVEEHILLFVPSVLMAQDRQATPRTAESEAAGFIAEPPSDVLLELHTATQLPIRSVVISCSSLLFVPIPESRGAGVVQVARLSKLTA